MRGRESGVSNLTSPSISDNVQLKLLGALCHGPNKENITRLTDAGLLDRNLVFSVAMDTNLVSKEDQTLRIR